MKKLTKKEKTKIIDQLCYSFTKFPRWMQGAVKHSMGSPEKNPHTGEYFNTFRDVLGCTTDNKLRSLLADFKENGVLLEVPIKADGDGPQYMVLM